MSGRAGSVKLGTAIAARALRPPPFELASCLPLTANPYIANNTTTRPIVACGERRAIGVRVLCHNAVQTSGVPQGFYCYIIVEDTALLDIIILIWRKARESCLKKSSFFVCLCTYQVML